MDKKKHLKNKRIVGTRKRLRIYLPKPDFADGKLVFANLHELWGWLTLKTRSKSYIEFVEVKK